MPVTPDHIGMQGAMTPRQWTSAEALLYAVAVGAGQDEPASELAYTTENAEGLDQRVVPSFICVAANGRLPIYEEIDFARMLHAEQGFELHRPLRPEGRVDAVSEVTGVWDKGSGKLITTRTRVTDADDGGPVATMTSGLFVRGEGGFGGERGPSLAWDLPDRAPDWERSYATRPEQALLYRLTGDRNPLHTDPAFARNAGFPHPILHGMATYGFTARALLHGPAGADPERFRGMNARFTKSVVPGVELTVQMWEEGDEVLFRTIDDDGAVVIDRGRARMGAA